MDGKGYTMQTILQEEIWGGCTNISQNRLPDKLLLVITIKFYNDKWINPSRI